MIWGQLENTFLRLYLSYSDDCKAYFDQDSSHCVMLFMLNEQQSYGQSDNSNQTDLDLFLKKY